MGNAYFDIVEKLKNATDIVDVVSKHVGLDGNHKGLCPFHDDHTPSFSVNAAGQYFHCFACHAGGDVIKFVQVVPSEKC